MYDSHNTIAQFLDAAAAKHPTPGGGSIAALTGALAAAMGEMSINYSVGRKDSEAFDAELRPALAELNTARGILLNLMTEDQTAYEALVAARKLPTNAPDRAEKYAAALLACIRVPQSIGATAISILEICDRVANFINPNLLSDLAVAADLAMATARCATYNVRVNLHAVTDESDRRSIEATTNRMLSHAAEMIQRVAPRIWSRYEQLG